MRSEDFFVAGLCFWSNVGAPRLGAPCGVSGRGAPLILGYQKSGVTPAAYSARLGRASGAKDKFTEIKTVASGLRPVDVFCGSGLTSMFNKDTPKHEICVPCVGRVSTRHGRLKSALRHAILVGCGRCFTLTHDTSSAVAGFGGRRFVVPHHEDAAKDCRCADSSKNAQAANPNQPDHGRPTKALRDNATRKLTHIAH